MPPSTPEPNTWLAFNSPGMLLDALGSVCDPDGCYPATVVQLKSGALVVELRADQAASVRAQTDPRGWMWSEHKPGPPTGTILRLGDSVPFAFTRLDLNGRALD